MLRTFIAGGADRFDVGALDHAQDIMSWRTGWDAPQIARARGWISGRNASGSSIYLRPAREIPMHPWILVDDVDEAAIEAMRRAGHPPGLVCETSPGSFQAWLRWPAPLDYGERTRAARALMRLYDGDPGGVGGHQPGRAPGTTNKKPSRRQANGLAPFARLRHAGDEVIDPGGLDLEADGEPIPTRGRPGGRGKEGGSEDQSRRDFALACRLVEAGRSEAEIGAAIRAVRSDRKGERADYIQRTIRAAQARVERSSEPPRRASDEGGFEP